MMANVIRRHNARGISTPRAGVPLVCEVGEQSSGTVLSARNGNS